MADFPGGQAIAPGGSDLLELPCDVVLPAALGGVITGDVARRMQCRWAGAAGAGGCGGRARRRRRAADPAASCAPASQSLSVTIV
jgi:glutamate dehydrogenase/leucine dehydrogenase